MGKETGGHGQGKLPETKGLTTEEAFERLATILTERLDAFKTSRGRNWREVLRSSLSTRSRHSTISWGSLLILFTESIIIFSLYSSSFSQTWVSLLPEGIVMFLLFMFNGFLVIFENSKRVNEMPKKLAKIIDQLREFMSSDISWDERNYPDLFMPITPCISMQWCYRDGKLINLPWALLVHGDVIVLQASQKIVADCELESGIVLRAGDTYNPTPSADESKSNHDAELVRPPKLHHPLKKCEATVISAPYLYMVDLSLELFLTRPPSFYNKERHTVVARIVESIILPLAIMTFVALCLVRMFYLPHWLGIRVAPWADIILLQPMASTFPLIPTMLPAIWSLLQCIGNAKLWKDRSCWGFDSTRDILASPGVGEKVVLNKWRQQTRNLMEQWNTIKDFFLGREETLHRSQKLLHILASMTALCCVDKKGLLSWPNPTVDKIFFLRSIPVQDAEEYLTSPPPPHDDLHRRRSSSSLPPSVPMTTAAEVLDITVDNNNELHFDDIHWENYLPNLKPLGLNILLNTCNPLTQKTYSAFHSHIGYELMNKEHALVVPVVPRRCLCEVSELIGFKKKATSLFVLDQELCSYRHIESDPFSHQLTKAKIKFPCPHMTSVILKEKTTQTLQLLSQGTGDLLADISEDFWDGHDLRPLTEYEKKLILDFYHRHSLTSICSAFSYKPVQTTVSPSIASLYMELPASKGLRVYPRGATTTVLGNPENSRVPGSLSVPETHDQFMSTDCLLELHSGNSEIRDVQGSLDMQLNQIFLGMMTMQHQACMDIVQLIEQLDNGCIRFVHFSKENELRSRVFSEKMGLESGWNCHISLTAEEECTNTVPMHALNRAEDESQAVAMVVDEEAATCRNNRLGTKRTNGRKEPGHGTTPEESLLLPRCTSSVPEMVILSKSNSEEDGECSSKAEVISNSDSIVTRGASRDESVAFGFSSDEDQSTVRVRFDVNSLSPDKQKSQDQNGPASGAESFSSAVASPDSYQEVFELVEQPTPLGIDLTNTAQLPVGIENIRPHLESVDNVPLLVSLFTDCNADNTREMINIMQDYGEVPLLLGSTCNYENRRLFVQADASVAVEPLYPQSCQKRPTFIEPKGNVAPTDIAMLLTSLPCGLSLKRKDCSLLYDLIAQARHFMNKCVRNSIQFWICCNCGVTFLGLIGLICLLPPLFSLSDAIWLSCVTIPLITMGLVLSVMNEVDVSVMSVPSWKNQMVIDHQLVMYAFWCYGMKFIPSLLNLTLMACFNLRWICEHLPNSTCSWVYPITNKMQQHLGEGQPPPAVVSMIEHSTRPAYCVSTWSCENIARLTYVQQFTVFFLVVYFVAISACFLHRSSYLWVRNPAGSKTWISVSVLAISLQLVCWMVKIGSTTSFVYDLLPVYSYIWGLLWVPIALALNELTRRHEFKVNIRYEKRARLDFGTKLGMNSPF